MRLGQAVKVIDNRLLILSLDDLLVLREAIVRHRLAIDIGDPDHRDLVRLAIRVDALLASGVDCG